jgi:tRNA U34 2-thiouridine synthase MnmA/TrmU
VELDQAEGEGTVLLGEPVEGVAPGQLACLMDDDMVVGHGTIA